MAPVGKKAIEHFSHPGHILSELKAETLFLCDGCKSPGQGTRYRCNPCDFDLHEYCGICPRSLSSFMHPHPLNLVLRKAKATRQNERVCDVCRDPIEGLFYRCSACEFDAHPLCTQLPQYIRHALHQVHPLRLQVAADTASQCAVCGGACSSWRYRCGACGFDIHIECVLASCDPPKQRQAPPPCGPSRSAPPPPPAPHYRAPPWGPSPPPPPYQAPPRWPLPAAAAAYGGQYVADGVPWGYNANYNMYGNGNLQPQSEGKSMYAVVGKLVFGVLSNVIFGTPGIDFSSFL